MSKDGWKDLPTDLLRIIFHYLEKQAKVDTYPISYIGFRSPNLLQCQLTCKNWSFLAESKLYNYIICKDPRNFELLLDSCSRNKDLVHYITFRYSVNDATQDIVISTFRKIALYFTELKAVYHYFRFVDEIWKLVKTERSKGQFGKLQVIPFKWSPDYDDIVQYNDMAWGLKNSLRELKIYDVNPAPVENTERLSHFPAVDTFQFKLSDFNNVYSIDQQLKKSRSVRSVDVDSIGFKNYTFYAPIRNSSSVNVLPYTRQLDIKKTLYDSKMFSYIMQVFPNLNKITLTPNSKTMAPLSTEITIQFLRYLLRIRNISVTDIPLQNTDQVLMGFYDQKSIVNRLDIIYSQDKEGGFSNVSIDTHNSKSIYINVKCLKESPKIILPRIGMIEKNVDNVQCIRMLMGFDIDIPDNVDLLVNQEDDDRLSNIFSKCPNLKVIYIASTILRTFGTSLQEKKIPFIEKVDLNSSLVYGSFLFDMSFHFPFIDQFEINLCRFDGETKDNVTVNMPDTKFTNITYGDFTEINKLYLKLITIENNTTSWFVGNIDGSNTCTENEYQNSLQDRKSLSLFIQCKQVNTFAFRSEEFDLVGKKILKLV
ncbi:hypothetical protein EDC94DRAFT_659200 [Helicostylum pulchrum]|nr:hypothetical protein EDC94DRAFT_659200 [Helicostylum pulchrum]